MVRVCRRLNFVCVCSCFFFYLFRDILYFYFTNLTYKCIITCLGCIRASYTNMKQNVQHTLHNFTTEIAIILLLEVECSSICILYDDFFIFFFIMKGVDSIRSFFGTDNYWKETLIYCKTMSLLPKSYYMNT